MNILLIYKQRNNYFGALAEVTSEVYAEIMSTKHVFLTYETCKFYEEFNINRCKNCCGTIIVVKSALTTVEETQTCYKCSEKHDPNTCRFEVKK